MLAQRRPEAEIIGLDGDAKILAIARAKVARAGLNLRLYEGLAGAPPEALEEGPVFAPGSFDRVVSSLVFHHLGPDEKRGALASALRLLRPGGELHILDWGKAQDPLMRFAFLGVQLLDGFRTTNENVRGRLPLLMQEAGFAEVAETMRMRTAFGTLSFYRGVRV